MLFPSLSLNTLSAPTSPLIESSHMAAFSHQNPSFLLDSVFLPSTPIKMSGLLEDSFINNSSSSSYFSYSFPSEPFHEIPIDVGGPECGDNGTSVTENMKTDSSSTVLDLEVSDQVIKRETILLDKRKNRDGSCLISSQSKNPKKAKTKKPNKCNDSLKETEEKKSKADKKNQKKVPQEPTTGYVHVRARRGEATDSHSLAERVRRERISERLKLLQSLVPGCDKVTSKALMLDEIINYVQSLQHQVEFLSMKLASISPMFYDNRVDLDALMPKSEKPSNLKSPFPSLQQTIPTSSTAFADTTTSFTRTNNYPLLDSSIALLLQQEQRSNSFSQNSENLLWNVDDQGQRLIDQLGFSNLCTFQESNMKPAPTSICNSNTRNPNEIRAPSLLVSVPMEWASSTLHSGPSSVDYMKKI